MFRLGWMTRSKNKISVKREQCTVDPYKLYETVRLGAGKNLKTAFLKFPKGEMIVNSFGLADFHVIL